MASVTSKTPMLRAAAARGYAAHAQAAAASRGSGEVQTTTLPNKLVVSSAEPNAPVSRISIAFRAGSRNETADSLGAAHVLRAAGGLSTKSATAFGITRNIQQAGGSLTSLADREVVSYSVAVTKDQLEVGLKYLEATATGQVFKPWELAELVPTIRNELARLPAEVQAVELLHKAAFRDGLGNSVFCPDYLVGKHSSETMQHYFATNCTTNRAAVAGVGVDHQLLVGFAQSLALESGAGGENKSTFNTGEVRREGAGSRAAVAVGAQAVGWKTALNEAAAFWVLHFAAGVGPVTKRGANNGALTKALGGVNCSALFNGYSDNGMFGFVVSGNAKDAGKAVEDGVKALKSLSVTDACVARGKALAVMAVADVAENQSSLHHQLGEESVVLGHVYKKNDLIAAVSAVTTSDVQAAARKVASSKLAIGAVGNLSHVPHLCELH
ncbi:cytochrome b-c1 complex subunit 2, mitochondrial [Anopheles marshallii]|uniref:cytochrome b-c1 complex subunit 2, mitochondrial n=1 Tax=Anopheles marshallii TaxID=1521116 RepID=UPI00237A4604|nr:cytochrome b-c1 complex subunit 2, mitochondrial [Anopheles marshallii]